MVPIEDKEHLIFEQFLTIDECEHISQILQRDEHKILRIPNSNPTNYTGTTAQYSVYNLLNHGDIRPLNIPDKIFALPQFQEYSDLWVQCWGNVLHQESKLPIHTHSGNEHVSMCACSIYIDGHDPSYTHWEDIGKTQNIRGDLQIVGQHHEHEVKTNTHTQPRISIAFDVYWKNENFHGQELNIARRAPGETTKFNYNKRFLHIRNPNKVVHRTNFEGMPITVKETNNTINLEFGEEWVSKKEGVYSFRLDAVNCNQINMARIPKGDNPYGLLWWDYVNRICEVVNEVESPKNALVLGLGGGVIPSWLHQNTECAKIDAVDIIPELEDISRRFFQMPETTRDNDRRRINVIIQDAYDFVLESKNSYDIIVVDICGGDGDEIDAAGTGKNHKFNSPKFYKGLKKILSPKGCIAINYFLTPETHDDYLKTLKKNFTKVTECPNPYWPKNKNCVTYVSS